MSSLKRVLHVLYDTTVHITCGTVSKTEKERNGQSRTNITKYVKEKLILFLKKELDIFNDIWHFGILMFTHWLSTCDHYVLPAEIFFIALLRQKFIYLELPMRVWKKTFNIHSRTGCSRRCILVYILFFLMHIYADIFMLSPTLSFPRDPSIEIWMAKSIFTLLNPT